MVSRGAFLGLPRLFAHQLHSVEVSNGESLLTERKLAVPKSLQAGFRGVLWAGLSMIAVEPAANEFVRCFHYEKKNADSLLRLLGVPL